MKADPQSDESGKLETFRCGTIAAPEGQEQRTGNEGGNPYRRPGAIPVDGTLRGLEAFAQGIDQQIDEKPDREGEHEADPFGLKPAQPGKGEEARRHGSEAQEQAEATKSEAEEAARFYASIFPDSRIDGVWSLPAESPSGPAGSVKIVDFTVLGQRFQAITAGPHHEFNDAISIVVLCDDQAELDRYWNALLAGGGKPQACGWINDKYGVRWQIVPKVMDDLMQDKDQAKAKRVTDAMLQMVKFDIAALERAARGEPVRT